MKIEFDTEKPIADICEDLKELQKKKSFIFVGKEDEIYFIDDISPGFIQSQNREIEVICVKLTDKVLFAEQIDATWIKT